jgi:hypothetical protein
MELLVNVEAQRRQNPLGETFLVGVPFMAATKCGVQQQEPEELQSDSVPAGSGPVGSQGRILEDSEAT